MLNGPSASLETVPSSLDELRDGGLWQEGSLLKLHLGCGETLLKGYINIDFPPTEHNVMTVEPEVYADILQLDFPANSVDEIRLHHVFEHFSRVTAIAMLIKWHQWLKVGGTLRIETPDIVGSAQNILHAPSYKIKMGNIRHLAGDQAASWAYHVDHWFEERFQRTLSHLGFNPVQTSSLAWDTEPFLWSVTAVATKERSLPLDELLNKGYELLWESTVKPEERPTYEVWCKQLQALLGGGPATKPANTTAWSPQMVKECSGFIGNIQSTEPYEEVIDFNQRGRDRWVEAKARTVTARSRVLDIGAGTCPYKHLFAHCEYKTHDFKQYEGSEKLGGTAEYGHIDYVSDVASIPVPDNSFDVILCTEVLEHVPEPIEALREMARIVKPGGRIFMTAPLGSGLHQLPFHFYGGYTPEWYKTFCAKFGLDILEIKANRGFHAHLAQMLARAGGMIGAQPGMTNEQALGLRCFIGEMLPRYFIKLDEQDCVEQFTVGFFVEARKPN